MRKLLSVLVATSCVLASVSAATPAVADDTTMFSTTSTEAALAAGGDAELLPAPCDEIGCGEPEPAPEPIWISCDRTLQGPKVSGDIALYAWGRARISCILHLGYSWQTSASMSQLTVDLTMMRRKVNSNEGWEWLGTWTATSYSQGWVEVSHSEWCNPGNTGHDFQLTAWYTMVPPAGWEPPIKYDMKTATALSYIDC